MTNTKKKKKKRKKTKKGEKGKKKKKKKRKKIKKGKKRRKGTNDHFNFFGVILTTPAESTNMRGIEQVESSTTCAMFNTGGSVNLSTYANT